MQFRYSLINNDTSTTTVVQEPIGWDSITFKLERDDKYHGFFDGIDSEGGLLKFFGTANTILRTAFIDEGFAADVDVLIEIECNDDWQTIFLGQLDFQTYIAECGLKGCYVSISAVRKGCLATFNNRLDQKVDITSLVGYDGATLPTYDGLDLNITLEPVTIVFGFTAVPTFPLIYEFSDPDPHTDDTQCFFFYFKLDRVQVGDIEYLYNDFLEYHGPTDGTYNGAYNDWFAVTPGLVQYNLPPTNLICTNDFTITHNISGHLYVQSDDDFRITAEFSIIKRPVFGPDVVIAVCPIATTPPAAYAGSPTPYDFSIFCFDTNTATLDQGDILYVQFAITDFQYDTASSPPVHLTWDFTVLYLSITAENACEATTADVFLVNETLSRATEIITDGCLLVKSDYFGRTDSKPYESLTDGCGSLEVITNGLRIRNALMQDFTKPKVELSFQELITGLNAIHNIGMGAEDDPDRPGEQLIRVEPYGYFYQSGITFSAPAVPLLKTSIATAKNVSTFKVGYKKWQTENFGGREDFHGTREYRTPLKTVQNTFDRTSDLIASGYALEITRREFGSTNKDFRYDNDIFIVCVERGYGNYIVELDNIADDANIYSPSTTYNFRISPLRNAMRWVKYVAQTLIPSLASSILKYTTGQGNVIATGLQINGCAIEDAAMAENSDIAIADFNVSADGEPIMYNLYDEFIYPLSFTDYLAILANPYGKVEYSCNDITYTGHIKKITYKPTDGKATFQLIRAYE